MSREPMNIVILGGSFAGISVAHNFLKNVIDQLGTTRTAPRYRVVLVSPSTHLYWNICAPRVLVSQSLIPYTSAFLPVIEAFRDYPANRFSFVHGRAIGVDFSQRSIAVSVITEPTQPIQNVSTWHSHACRATASGSSTGKSTQAIRYHALIIATGSFAHSPLLSLHGPHEKTLAALDAFHAGLRDASSIIIVGGGPSGVECAGQLATYYNRGQLHKMREDKSLVNSGKADNGDKPHLSTFSAIRPKRLFTILSLFSRRLVSRPTTSTSIRTPKHIALISGSERLLPHLPPSIGQAAEIKLRKLGVHIIHNVRLVSASEKPSGHTVCLLSNDITISCDLFIAATGVSPNTDFLPPELLDASGYVLADPRTLRVERAGERVYALGDCAAYSGKCIADVYDAVPPLLHNLRNDLWAYEIRRQNPYGGTAVLEQLQRLEDLEYAKELRQTQMIPITKWGGVGVLFGVRLPSLAVDLLKGRDYLVGRAKDVVSRGFSPYAGIS